MPQGEKESLLKHEAQQGYSSSSSSSDDAGITQQHPSLNEGVNVIEPLIRDDDDNDIEKDLEISVKSVDSCTSRTALSGGLDTGEKGTSNIATIIHIFKGNIGTGILSLPAAIKHAGIVVGPIALLFVAFTAVHCMHLLVRSSHFFCRKTGKQAMSYGDVAQECTKGILGHRSSWAKRIVNTFLVVTQLGFCSIYFLFVASTIVEVAEWEGKVDKRLVIIITAIPVIFLSYIRSLEKLAYLSIISNVLCVFGLVVVYQYLIRNMGDPTALPAFAGTAELPMFFAMALFSFEGIGVVLPLENEMKKPEDFGWVLNISMGVISVMFVSMGLLGYAAFGDNIQGSVSLNLPDNILYDVVKLCYALAMFLTYFLQFYVPIQILLPPLLTKWQKRHESCFEYTFRTVLVLLTAALAASIPFLDDFIALIGAAASAGLAVIFPPLFHLLTFRKNGLHPLAFIKDVCIMSIGVFGFMVGSYTAIKKMVGDFKGRHVLIHNMTHASNITDYGMNGSSFAPHKLF